MTEDIKVAEGNVLNALDRLIADKRARRETEGRCELPKEELRALVHALYALGDLETVLQRDMGDLLGPRTAGGTRVISRSKRQTRSM